MFLILIVYSIYSCASLFSTNYLLRIRALNKVNDQDILFGVALNDKIFEVQTAAFNKITDQNLINRLAIESKEKGLKMMATNKVIDQNILFKVILEATDNTELQLMAINKVTDQNILFKIVLETSNDIVQTAAFNKIIDQNLINRIAVESIESKLRLKAINIVIDQNILYKIALLDVDYDNYVAAMKRLTQSQLAKLVTEAKDLKRKSKVIDLLNDQIELMNIAQNNNNWDVRQAAFLKLNNNSLYIISRETKEPANKLAAKIRLGLINWSEIFSGLNSSAETLGDVIGAAALILYPQPTTSDIVSACHTFISRGDASRIPELINLLNRFGDVTLAEDFINCGNEVLFNAGANWGKAHGYEIQTGDGSHRVRWGKKY
jgi:hypothetical protein